jgi:hypothetical protein
MDDHEVGTEAGGPDYGVTVPPVPQMVQTN